MHFCHFFCYFTKEQVLERTSGSVNFKIPACMNVFVAKLSPATTGKDLEKIFSEFGEVVSAKVIFDRDTGSSKGYGFVEMLTEEQAKAAIIALNETEIDGKQIVVREANLRVENTRPKKTLLKKGNLPEQE
jgi:RNA recognition motif-containing protein